MFLCEVVTVRWYLSVVGWVLAMRMVSSLSYLDVRAPNYFRRPWPFTVPYSMICFTNYQAYPLSSVVSEKIMCR